MARDKGLEELIHGELHSVPGITEKGMFGGWAWLLHGKLLCGARADGMLVRLGKGRARSKSRESCRCCRAADRCCLRCNPNVYSNSVLRQKLLSHAIEFVRSLPGGQCPVASQNRRSASQPCGLLQRRSEKPAVDGTKNSCGVVSQHRGSRSLWEVSELRESVTCVSLDSALSR